MYLTIYSSSCSPPLYLLLVCLPHQLTISHPHYLNQHHCLSHRSYCKVVQRECRREEGGGGERESERYVSMFTIIYTHSVTVAHMRYQYQYSYKVDKQQKVTTHLRLVIF